MSDLKITPAIRTIVKRIAVQEPFKILSETEVEQLFAESKLLSCVIGQRILRPDCLPDCLYIVLSGKVRLLGESVKGSETLSIRGSGQILGWISLLRGVPSEWVIASEETTLLAISSKSFISVIGKNEAFLSSFSSLSSQHELHTVLHAAANNDLRRFAGWDIRLKGLIDQENSYWTQSIAPNVTFIPPKLAPDSLIWMLSSGGVPGTQVGARIFKGDTLPERKGFNLPYRMIGILPFQDLTENEPLSVVANQKDEIQVFKESTSHSLQQLGILEEDLLSLDDKYPIVRGKSQVDQALAVSEMIALHQQVPFRRDVLSKVLDAQFRRDKEMSLELMAGLQEILGLNCTLADVDTQHLLNIEAPAIFFLEDVPVVLFANTGTTSVIGHPCQGLIKITSNELREKVGSRLKFALPRRVGTTPNSRFGWGWFTPLLGKYKRALVLVFVSSLLAQLFGLAIPLLIQQIIDKVLTQGNLSSLNVLGTLMIVLALFQGVLMVLRTYIFVDTTDRMDLTLGTAVIDRLLALPLTYFEKRPVGELSQRLGELNTIRGFLTGTALVSVLNVIFAILYLVVMIIYSPFLTAVALSTLPLYILLVFGVAPIYKNLIRKRAVASARTQSHLIEVLGGIQTVKAQHFELTARWKWQDRYRHFVTEGFKSTALGATSGEIGNFLNQVSGLLVLWLGMGLVLKGELTLGMLIAFRIISGNVTGPLLQLSGLYQGFQKVQLSMERLGDILDQNPELNRAEDVDQISMPSIKGAIRFEDVRFRFGTKGPYQVEDVNLNIPESSFVGIVGQSGSGKSTLTKLIPKLYELDRGRIFIDDYDIAKVNLSSLRRQIGIVPQDSLLFEGTISENIALNDPQASDDSIMEAAKMACAHDFIMSLGQGYATPLAEKGSNLSGGQRQRIAIARTILSNPQLLVMDEATSALDYNTERELCLNLQKWAKGRTVLFITHRLSSIKTSDLILVMHEGKLVEEGTHSELLENAERYATLYQQQNN